MQKNDLILTLPFRLRYLVIRNLVGSPWTEQVKNTRCIFVHIPRTAGTSFGRALYGLDYSHPLLDYFVAYDRTLVEQYFKFAVVRNPWDRFVSAFGKMQLLEAKGLIDPTLRYWKKLGIQTFDQLVEALEIPSKRRVLQHIIFFRPQSEMLFRSEYELDFIGRFEKLNDCIATVEDALGTRLNLGVHNSSERKPYTSYYRRRQIEVVGRFYEEDVKRLSYRFGIDSE